MTTPTPGGAGRYADSVYDRNAPGQRAGMDAYVRASGYSSNEERLTDLALQAQTMPSELLRGAGAARPLFPPRFTGPRTQPGISDVVQVDRRYPDSSAQYSGQSGSYSGSSTPSLGWW